MKLKYAKKHAWVTAAVTDEEAKSALILAGSLKRVVSSRCAAILVSTKVAPNVREQLHDEFDYVYVLEEDRNTANLSAEEFSKLSALSLKAYERCVFLSPKMMFLKNGDEIFDRFENSNFVPLEKDESMQIFLYKPSMNAYGVLMKALGCRNGTPVFTYIQTWFSNQYSDQELYYLDSKYCRNISLQKGLQGKPSPTETVIVNFLDDPLSCQNWKEGDNTHLSLVDYHAIKTWLELHNSYFGYEDGCSRPWELGCEPRSFRKDVEYKTEPIAIIGMSCRFPGSNNLEEFWNLLINGEDGTGTPPPFRWLREQSSRNRPDCRKTNAGFLKVPVDDFDSKFFGISPKEALFMDPQHRLLHELVWEGLEDAAIDPMGLRGSTGGVFMGSWTNDFKDILDHSGESEFYRTYMGNSIGAAAARISFMLGLTGPSVATESGCSSAMVAVHLACRSLQLGETNLALACGVNLLLHPFDKDEMPMVISPEGRCKTFSDNADGFARGEGCGVLVLKRLSEAIRDKDNIWGLIRGTGVSQEGVSRSMGTPTVHGEALAMTQALRNADMTPEQVSYLEAHGTGTVVGDPLEVSAIAKAYHSKARKEPLVIGSVKTNVGHTESCSGITGIIKVVLAMKHEVIPPHRNFERLNPNISLESVPAIIPLDPMNWKRYPDERRRIAGVSSFGITGTDAHAIIEEPPEMFEVGLVSDLERPQHLLKISAKTEEALDKLLGKYAENIESSQEQIADIAYTANIGRANFPWRAVVTGKSREEFVQKIRRNDILKAETTTEDLEKICFLFTGQGSQHYGMAKQLYETNAVFQMHFDHCEGLLREMYNLNIRDVIWNESRKEDISRTIYSQTSIFCVEYALFRLLESWGIKPDYVVGHSLGEFCAAVCAGILTVEDALKLVAERSLLIDELPPAKMLVIRGDKESLEAGMNKFSGGDPSKILDFACINSRQQTVVAGDSDSILMFAKYCEDELKLKSVVLEATHAFHSKHMDPILNEYRYAAAGIGSRKKGGLKCGYISGMYGTLLDGDAVNTEYWVQHTRKPVHFLGACKTAVEHGCQVFIEVGPQPVLSALAMMNNQDKLDLSYFPTMKRNESDWDTILQTVGKLYLKGVPIDWEGFDELYRRKKVRLPHYPFIGKKFWPDTLATTGNIIHPLLGTSISNASSIKIFENGLTTRCLEYVKDHGIGEHIIFPGAGYLEMALAAGHSTVQNCTDTLTRPNRPMKLEKLTISAPLTLEESKTKRMQVVVGSNTTGSKNGDDEWDNLSIKIFQRLESKWLPHATAEFTPFPSVEELKVARDLVDIKMLEGLFSQSSDESLISQMYAKFASVGLKFGPTFQSIEKVWKDETGNGLLTKVKIPPDSQQYIVHPVILDSMIQTVMMQKLSDKVKKKLYVPISISKFLWLAAPQGQNLYVYTSATDTEENQAILLDHLGNVIGVMSGIQLIDTTVKAVESVLEQQRSVLPEMWEETWRPRRGPMFQRIPDHVLAKPWVTNEFLKFMESTYNTVSEETEGIFQNLEEFVYLWILNTLYELGWQPRLGQILTARHLVQRLKLEENHTKFVNWFMEVLQEYGIVQGSNRDWKVIAIPLGHEAVKHSLNQSIYTDDLVKKFDSTRLLRVVGENLPSILQGKLPALQVLFPENSSNIPSITGFYQDYGSVFNVVDAFSDALRQRLSLWLKGLKKGESFVFRVLEVGAGTGFFTAHVLPVLAEFGIEYEYFYTDISPAFFSPAEKKFESYKSSMKFQKLNIEEDPISQGFPPNYFDYVIASDVVHATMDVCQTLRNIRKLLRSAGNFDIFEQIQKNRLITFMFGLMEGFWRMTDFRKDHCILTAPEWKRCLEKTGFDEVITLPSFNGRHGLIVSKASTLVASEPEVSTGFPTWLIFSNSDCQLSHFISDQFKMLERKTIHVESGIAYQEWSQELIKLRENTKADYERLMTALGPSRVEGIIYLWAVNKNRTKQEEILQPYFYIAQTLFSLKQKVPPRLIAVTKGVAPIGDSDLSHYHTSTLWGFTKTFRNENSDVNCRCISVPRDVKAMSELEMREVFHELWSEDKEPQVAYQNGHRHIARFQPLKLVSHELPLPPGTNRFKLILPDNKSIEDLQFGPLDHFILADDEIEIQVKASALNFRDVFSVLKPTEEFKNISSVGFDFAGRIRRVGAEVTKWQVGDHVFGVNVKGDPLPSHIKMNEKDVLPVPDSMTLCEAATLPAVVSTSYHCLIDIAKIKESDTVLIHAASGGVGLSAIDIVKSIGCKIIATAGSKRKQNYLRSLGIQHIFHSRNIEYANEILKVTNGHGVDVVLNSLTSDGFKEATLKACAPGARFVEMSKLNIWTKEQVYEMRPDIEYTVVDVSQAEPGERRRLLEQIQELSEEKVIRPIPYVRFDALNIREALRYLQKAKHIGKVVCVMPEPRLENGEFQPYTPLFNDRSTYLITGGLGGIGFEVCKWMVERGGAKHVVLAGRREPSKAIQEAIDQLNCGGAHVVPVQLDISDFQQCKQVLEELKAPKLNLPPLRGIMHAAGILNDGLIANIDWDKLSSTFDAKVKGTLNLHKLSLGYPLEHFVLFSSVVSLYGSPGQCNHAAGNSFEDSIAHYRNSMGLCATSINWGQWGETGIAVEVELPGMKALSTLQGISALELLMKTQRVQSSVMNVESFVMLNKFSPQVAVYLDERIWKAGASTVSSTAIKSDEFWQEYELKDNKSEKVLLVKRQLKNILRKILKLEEDDPIEDDAYFQEMGVDSLMFIELKNGVQALLGDRVTVSANSLQDCNSTSLLAEQLVLLMEGGTSTKMSESPPTFEDVAALIREDCILPEHITGIGRQFKNVQYISTVLLTGATGTLGPYILKELANLPQISEIYCLIRPSKSVNVEKRLRDVLQFRDLQESVDMKKVKCVQGNISKSNLGMEAGDWNHLVEIVDAVFHIAAKADHTQYYRKREIDVEDVRAVNIGGTKNLLEFACSNKHHVKHIFFSSSLLSVATTEEDGCLSESWPEISDFDGVTTFAYPNSKFVGDVLMRIAALERGIPTKVFRLPLIAGDSKTGRFNIDQNHMMLRYLFVMKCGLLPTNPFPMVLLPVDVCAAITVKLFFHSELSSQQSDIFNITHPQPDLDQEFPKVAESFGYPIKFVEFSEFTEKLFSEPEGSTFSMFKGVYRNENELMSLYTFVRSLRKWLEGTENFWVSKKMLAVCPEFYSGLERTLQCLQRDLQYAKGQGLFEKFGLKKYENDAL